MARKKRDANDEALDRRVGYTIYRERERKGWTIQALAERAGVHENTVTNVENGAGISSRSLWRIAGALGVEVGALMPKPQSIVAFPPDAPLFS